MYPNGVPPSVFLEGRNPFRVEEHGAVSPRVARLRGQPWAMRRNSFGVKTAPHNTNLELLKFEICELPTRTNYE